MTTIVKSDRVRVTPLIGGSATDGICTLLEIGGVRLLLDCGCSADTGFDQISTILNDLSQIGGVHAVLLTHGDFHHIGALPYLLGVQGLGNTPVFCTSPVSKFGQVMLYDYALNKSMEGTEDMKIFDFDDIDSAFSNAVTLKFNQSVVVPDKDDIFRTGPPVSVCAVNAGRTIGGSIWKIRCGPTEIVYMVDINLKKELMLDGVSMESLPSSPALLLTDAGSRVITSSTGEAPSRRTTKKDKDDSNTLITMVMETMRAGGNVLIPVETAGRTLELMQILGKHWYDQKLGLYNLVFLSHMSKNVPEFARMQLEWMSDSLSRGFYNGKPNPFDLPQIRFATSLREIERFCPGPKTVLATDAGLTSGLAKELLLKWGGDPRCRVIFADSSDPGSLAAELRQKAAAPPVIATITRPVRVELVGAELAQYRMDQDKQRRLKEEALQRKRRQEELSKFNVGAGAELIDDEEDAMLTLEDELSRKKPKVDLMRTFLEPNFTMFESRELSLTVDEYGASIDDLTFKDIQSSDIKWLNRGDKMLDGQKPGAPGSGGPGGLGGGSSTGAGPAAVEEEVAEDSGSADAIPTKLITTSMRVQFTCEFREVNLGSRADPKAIRTMISKMTPSRVIVLRGSDSDCTSLMSFAKINSIEGFTPKPRGIVSFEVRAEKLRVQVPQGLLPSAMRPVRVFQSSTGALTDTKCSVVALQGVLEESKLIAQEGTRLIKYQGISAPQIADIAHVGSMNIVNDSDGSGAAEEKYQESQENQETQEYIQAHQAVADSAADQKLRDKCIGVVSVGEVTLNSLKLLIEATGTAVESRIDSQGALLMCGDQVIVRKQDRGDFAIEGPPVPAFYEARKALYQQFAFV